MKESTTSISPGSSLCTPEAASHEARKHMHSSKIINKKPDQQQRKVEPRINGDNKASRKAYAEKSIDLSSLSSGGEDSDASDDLISANNGTKMTRKEDEENELMFYNLIYNKRDTNKQHGQQQLTSKVNTSADNCYNTVLTESIYHSGNSAFENFNNNRQHNRINTASSLIEMNPELGNNENNGSNYEYYVYNTASQPSIYYQNYTMNECHQKSPMIDESQHHHHHHHSHNHYAKSMDQIDYNNNQLGAKSPYLLCPVPSSYHSPGGEYYIAPPADDSPQQCYTDSNNNNYYRAQQNNYYNSNLSTLKIASPHYTNLTATSNNNNNNYMYYSESSAMSGNVVSAASESYFLYSNNTNNGANLED